MNGFQVFFWLCLAVGLFGLAADLYDRASLYQSKRRHKAPPYIRKWVTIQSIDTKPQYLTVKVIDSGKKELVSYLKTVRDEPFANYEGLNYSQLLATVTKEEALQIKELKEFLL